MNGSKENGSSRQRYIFLFEMKTKWKASTWCGIVVCMWCVNDLILCFIYCQPHSSKRLILAAITVHFRCYGVWRADESVRKKNKCHYVFCCCSSLRVYTNWIYCVFAHKWKLCLLCVPNVQSKDTQSHFTKTHRHCSQCNEKKSG